MKFFLAFLAVFILSATPAAAEPAKVVVFAAASLKGPLDEAAAAYKSQTGVDVAISYAGSNVLAKQIEQGAPAGVFISADEDWMNELAGKALIKADSRFDMLSNELALVTPADSKLAIAIKPGFALSDAIGSGKLAMANPDAVPAGKYGKAALVKLGVWDSVSAKVASAENVRAALALVATGEAPLGIVYQTDAKAEPKVRIVALFPADSHAPIVYPAALTSPADEDAAKFLAFLKTPPAMGAFTKAGFGAPGR